MIAQWPSFVDLVLSQWIWLKYCKCNQYQPDRSEVRTNPGSKKVVWGTHLCFFSRHQFAALTVPPLGWSRGPTRPFMSSWNLWRQREWQNKLCLHWKQQRVKVDQWLFGCVLRLRISHMDEFAISSAFLNSRSNNYFFLSKAPLKICVDLHRNQSFLKSYSAFSSPSLPGCGPLVFGQADRLSKKNSPVVCAEGRRSQASFLAQPQCVLYPLCPCDLGATTTLEVPCFWGEITTLELCWKTNPQSVVYFVDW